MKKIVLSIAGVMAIAAFAPEASALPVFARQTGMACSACHFQHFPLLNGFGRAFKAGGFTMMGAQAKVEGDDLSIPATLNMAVLTSMGYVKTNQDANLTGQAKNNGNGTWGVPGVGGGGGVNEASLFFGGHVTDFAGFLSEMTLAPNAKMDSAKTPILFDVAGSRVGFVPFATNAQGASYGMETLNTGANAVHMQSNTVGPNNEFAKAMSAQQYLTTNGNAVGIAFVGTNDMGFVNFTKYQQTGIANGATAALGSTYARLAGTFDLAGWDAGVGIQNWSGASLASVAAAVAPATVGVGTMQQTKASAIDGQLQGDIGGMPVGFYASYARAPGTGATTAAGIAAGVLANTYNAGTLTRSSFNVNAEVGVLPGIATIGAAVRQGKSGVADAAGGNMTDNAIMLTATYKLAQNMMARLSYVSQTGGYWSATAAGALAATTTNANVVGSKTTMLNMYVLF